MFEASQIVGPYGPITTGSAWEQLQAVVDCANVAKRQIESFVPIEGRRSSSRGSDALSARLGWAQVIETLDQLGKLHRSIGCWSDPSSRNFQRLDWSMGQNAAALQLMVATDKLRTWFQENNSVRTSARPDLEAALYSDFADGLAALSLELPCTAQAEQPENQWSECRTPSEWASRFGRDPATLRRWKAKGKIHPEVVGPKLWRFRKDELAKMPRKASRE
jgi:hypothetical protein